MVEFPSRITLAQTPTPLQPLDRLSEQVGGPRIWVKRDDLTGCAITGNKVRKLEFVLAQAIEQGADTLITCGGLQSNPDNLMKLDVLPKSVPEGFRDKYVEYLAGKGSHLSAIIRS